MHCKRNLSVLSTCGSTQTLQLKAGDQLTENCVKVYHFLFYGDYILSCYIVSHLPPYWPFWSTLFCLWTLWIPDRLCSWHQASGFEVYVKEIVCWRILMFSQKYMQYGKVNNNRMHHIVQCYYLSVCHEEIASSEYVIIISTLFTISATFSLKLESKDKQTSLWL
jgi:hypothetical protein